MGPAIPEVAGATPAVWVHGTMWKKSKKYVGAAEMNAHLMIDRALVGQPKPFEYEGG